MFGREDITREILGNVPGGIAIAFYVLAALACGFAAFKRRRAGSARRDSPQREIGSC